jgi:hypothetical protein
MNEAMPRRLHRLAILYSRPDEVLLGELLSTAGALVLPEAGGQLGGGPP